MGQRDEEPEGYAVSETLYTPEHRNWPRRFQLVADQAWSRVDYYRIVR
jgi:hypothetical protein